MEGMDTKQALERFDQLPAVRNDEMIGSWAGSGLPTGHRLDGLLETLGWKGKRFEDQETVHPLVFADSRGEFLVDPAWLPARLLPHAGVLTSGAVGRVAESLSRRGLLRVATTRRPGARLRRVEHRGMVSAAMVYDALPIIDHFRRLDEVTLLGLMDARALEPYFFQLHRQ